jgi:hydrogenase-4 component B
MSAHLAIPVAAALLMGASGILCLVLPARGGARDALFAVLMAAAGATGAASAISTLAAGTSALHESAWLVPLGRLALRIDAISALFLVPVFLVPALGAVFGAAYWCERDNPRTAPALRVFYGLTPAGMAGVMLAQDGILLLLSWEVMAVAAFFAVATEDDQREVRDAAWVYLVATHLGTLCLLGFLTLLSSATGSFDLVPLAPGAIGAGTAGALFLLGLGGFGVKAGIMPLHVWLPGAHANAPSHVSAMLSGVMLKVGVYGIVRVAWMLPAGEEWWSWVLIGLGAASAVIGIAFALGQRDAKRLLAYSSIENVGVIVLAIGVAMLGRSTGDAALAALGLAGALLHVWNHALLKSLLFLVAGSFVHACGTRRMNALGGLAVRMPRTALCAAIGCAALSALPPLNGFVSEWLLYRGLVGSLARDGTETDPLLAVAVLALALTGALALAAFVKLFATTFLGQARSEAAEHAHEPAPAMLAPMGLLAAACAGIGLLPAVAMAPVARAVALWTGGGDAGGGRLPATSLATISAIGAATIAVAVAIVLWLRAVARRSSAPRTGTWDCGYAAPTARMQYGESSFAELLVGLFRGVLVPWRRRPEIGTMFPAETEYASETPDVVLDRGIVPLLHRAARAALRLRLLQQGWIQMYVLYILLGLILLLILA